MASFIIRGGMLAMAVSAMLQTEFFISLPLTFYAWQIPPYLLQIYKSVPSLSCGRAIVNQIFCTRPVHPRTTARNPIFHEAGEID